MILEVNRCRRREAGERENLPWKGEAMDVMDVAVQPPDQRSERRAVREQAGRFGPKKIIVDAISLDMSRLDAGLYYRNLRPGPRNQLCAVDYRPDFSQDALRISLRIKVKADLGNAQSYACSHGYGIRRLIAS
jgi:hypothetical protein